MSDENENLLEQNVRYLEENKKSLNVIQMCTDQLQNNQKSLEDL